MSITTGLVSISFRSSSVDEVIAMARDAGLAGIEWGGDGHCPHGDLRQAMHVRSRTAAAGLTIAAYGSYYRLGVSEAAGLSFAAVLTSARALGAPLVRVWAGDQASATCPRDQRQAVIVDARRVAEQAADHGIRVLSEWHAGTLTDSLDSGLDFLKAVDHDHLATIWQPSSGQTVDQAMVELDAVLPWVEHLHVFHWRGHERLPLADGRTPWARYLAMAATTGRAMTAALEFVRDDAPLQLAEDARTLHTLIKNLP